MKIPLRYQNTEYDCGTTTFVNALAYLYDREDIPVELLKAIYRLTLDLEDSKGIVGGCGTSTEHSELLAKYFVKYANGNNKFDIECKVLRGAEVNIKNLKKNLTDNSVIIARCYQEVEHYVLITKIDDMFAYIFDPYYLEEDYYLSDDDVAIILHESFSHNRLVKIERLFVESKKDFSLLNVENRFAIVISR